MDEDPPPPPAKPSPIPSWVTLGFVLGALFVWALPRNAPAPPEVRPAGEIPTPTPANSAGEPKIATIDAVFAEWGRYAVWSDGTTEVALWGSDTKSFSDCYEVVKVNDEYYFRPIASLTRPILTHGIPENPPLRFTETERQREEWLGEVQKENWKEFTEGGRQPTALPAVKKPDGD
jgi:hypothetical protein